MKAKPQFINTYADDYVSDPGDVVVLCSPDGGVSWPWSAGTIRGGTPESQQKLAETVDKVVHNGRWVWVTVKCVPAGERWNHWVPRPA